MSSHPAVANVEHLLREYAPQVLGAMVRRHDDFSGAEDAVQEALLAAIEQWPVAGVPTNPRGWLYEVANRKRIDAVRSDVARRRREELTARDATSGPFAPPADHDLDLQHDDSLVLLTMCCHPSLTPTSAIALTLRAVGGLTTREIASAFLVPEATMAQRISRAKQTIATSGVHFALPEVAERADRYRSVLRVLYLMFNEGYTTSSGHTLQRTDLSNEAIRLGRMLRALLPADAEVSGLLALMLLTDARRHARSGPHGELIPLDEQDRSLWDRTQVAEGVELLAEAMSRGAIGPYQLQAAIAALHDEAPSTTATDWPQILALYRVLRHLADNPMVELNHAVAVAMVHGPAEGLALLARLDDDPRMATHHRLDAVRAHLLERLGDHPAAVRHYRAAAERTASMPERNYLNTRAARLSPGAVLRSWIAATCFMLASCAPVADTAPGACPDPAPIRALMDSHLERYPAMEIADALKLLQQATMGIEHAVTDSAGALAWMQREWNAMGRGPVEPSIDTLGAAGKFVRVHLRPFREAGGDPGRLTAAFIATSRTVADTSLITCALAAVAPVVPWDSTAWTARATQWRAEGFPAMHHSEHFAQQYQPAYRVVGVAHVPTLLNDR